MQPKSVKGEYERLRRRIDDLVRLRQEISAFIWHDGDDLAQRAQKIRDSKNQSRFITADLRHLLHSLEQLDYLKAKNLQRAEIRKSLSETESLGEFDDCDLRIGEDAKLLDQIEREFPELGRGTGSTPYVRRIDVPEGTRWEDVTIEFVNDDTIQIRLKDSALDSLRNYQEAGFEDRRGKNRPVRSWQLLRELAQNEVIRRGNAEKDITRVEKGISDLRVRLRKLIGIDEDPMTLDGPISSRFYRSEFKARLARTYQP